MLNEVEYSTPSEVPPGTRSGRPRFLLAVLVLACAVLVLLFGGTLASQLHNEREERIAAARDQVASLSQVLEAHLLQSLGAVDLTLQVLRNGIQARIPAAGFDGAVSKTEMNIAAKRLPEVRAFAVIDRNGDVIVLSDVEAEAEASRLNFSDRSYFSRHRRSREDRYLTDGPYVARYGGDAYITISRRIDQPDGSFAGVVVAGIRMQHFEDFYATLDLPRDSVVALFERDGTFLMRFPDPGGIMGRDYSDRPLFTEHLAAAPHGAYVSPPQSDGVVRITGYRTVEGFDLVVAVAYSREEVLAGWRRRLAVESLLFLLFCGVLAAAAFYGTLQYRRLALSNRQYRHADRRRAEFERQQLAVLDAAPANIAILDSAGTIILVNEAWRRFARENGYAGEAAGVGENYLDICRRGGTATPHAAEAAAGLSAVLEGRQMMAEFEYPCHAPTEQRWYRVIFSPLPSETGGAIATHVDVTARKQAELVLQRHARQQQSIARLGQQVLEREGLDNGLSRTADLVAEAVDAESVALYRLEEGELELLSGSGRGRPETLLRDGPDSPEWRAMMDNETRVLPVSVPGQHGGYLTREVAFVPIRRGQMPWGVLTVGFSSADPPVEETLTFLGSIATILGNALTRRSEQRLLRENEGFLAAVLDNMGDALVTYDASGYVTRANRAAHEVFGYPPDGLIGRPVRELVPEELREEQQYAFRRHLRHGLGGVHGLRQHFEGLRSDGTRFPVELVLGEADREGRRFFIGLLRDLTEANRLEGQLRQWQRLEAVGQLTGGIAHDFNNLLTVILGNAELLVDGVLDEAETRQSLNSIIAASENAVDLTSRLLAFARRQPLAPAVFDMNELVEGMELLLRRTVPESIELRTDLSDDLHEVRADRGQLENAIINLVVNARDAIGDGGKIHIHTANAILDEAYARLNPDVEPGDYVMIAVSDDGHGMKPSDVERAFEPFFTTKAAGRGTGLGLSMVYGFARQSDGHAKIYSEIGHGTTVRIYLPRAGVPAGAAAAEPAAADAPRARAGETVLVVEDNEQVRAYAVQLIGNLGYEVLEAEDGVAALDLLDSERRIDLVFTDMVMPGGLTGVELADHARELRPGLAVICATGYAPGAQATRSDITVLSKPYRRDELARRLRETLDRRSS